MLERWLRLRRSPAWTVVLADADGVRFARTENLPGRKPRLRACGEIALAEAGGSLPNAVKKLAIRPGAQCATLLAANEYQIVLVQPPDVPPEERKAAMQWRLKELIDYPIEEASYDTLNVPLPRNATVWDHVVYAVTARKETLRSLVARLDDARVRVTVIDVPEVAQRNITALLEDDDRGTAMIYLDDSGALLTLNYNGDMYLARRFEITMKQVRDSHGEQREEVLNRVLLEVQRTLDNFERQFGFVAVSKIIVGPEPEDSGLRQYFSANLDMRVDGVDLRAVIDIDESIEFDIHTQWRMFHLIGCSLRPPATVQ